MELKALQQMFSQFRQVQERLEKEIGDISVEASAGGGMVTVKMNGQKQLTEVRVEPDIFKSKDQEMLQDLMLSAVNEATRRVDEELSRQVKDITGSVPGLAGMKIPGLF
jgi:DNA-binding YbaB/EbfC family protein